MLQITGDIWNFHKLGPVCVATNGIVKVNGEAVMGAGVALEAAKRFPSLPRELGNVLDKGNHVWYFSLYNLFTFPTKNHWKDNSSLELIEQSAIELLTLVEKLGNYEDYEGKILPSSEPMQKSFCPSQAAATAGLHGKKCALC